MNKGWLELESDPGLFTLLVEDFGVEGVQVEEIYDLQKPPEGPVYGFIFLFKWIEERRSRRKITQEEESFVTDENIVNNIFFGQQIIANSCATHALVSVLMNTEKDIKLGDMLTQLKDFTKGMNPEDKGDAIGNMPDLARAHNKHARPEPYRLPEKQQAISVRTKEAFHFVSYVPIQGRLFELDGLKPYPIDHGPWGEQEEWTDQFFRVISERLGGEPYQDIRFNLMAVVPDRRQMYEQKLKTLKTNRQIVLEALQQMVKVTGTLTETSLSRHGTYTMAGKTAPICTRSYTAAAKEAAAVVAASKQESDDSESAFSVPDIKVESDVEVGSQSESSDMMGNQSDITQPLSIETKFSSGTCTGPRSSGSSTDTASEVASLLSTPTASNPNSAQCSPLVSPEKGIVSPGHLAIQQMPLDEKLAKAWELQAQLEAGGKLQHRSAMDCGEATEIGLEAQTSLGGGAGGDLRDPLREARDRYPHQGFTPKELLELLKNVENEISLNESNLREENDKRKKYKIDSCRRTHNYDQFIFTFLSMLAEQGQLGSLVEDHMLVKRKQGVNVGRLHRIAPKPPDKKRARARPKKRR